DDGAAAHGRAGEAELPVALRPAVDRHADRHRLHAAVQHAVADLGGDVALGLVLLQRAAGRLDGVRDQHADRLETGLLVGGELSAELPESVVDEDTVAEGDVTGDAAALAQV